MRWKKLASAASLGGGHAVDADPHEGPLVGLAEIQPKEALSATVECVP